MKDLLSELLDVAIIVFAVTSMLSVGLAHPVQRIVGPLRDVLAVLRALLANFVLVPLLALVVVRLISIEQPLRVGLLLIAMSAGAPFLIKLTEATQGPVARSAALLVLLLPATIVYTPLVVPLVLRSGEVRATAIAAPLVATMLLPLAVGLLARQRWRDFARRLHPVPQKTSTVALVAIVVTIVLADFPVIVELFRKAAIIPALLVVGGAFVIGYLMGGPDRDRREVFGLGTSQRNTAAATVIATQSFSDPATVTMVVVTSLVGFVILLPIAWALRGRRRRSGSTPR